MSNIVFSQEAIKDLGQIKAYICDDLGNEKSATGTVRKIMQNIRQLANFPLSGAHLRSIIDYETDYRYIVCGNYHNYGRMN